MLIKYRPVVMCLTTDGHIKMYSPDQLRDAYGRWVKVGGLGNFENYKMEAYHMPKGEGEELLYGGLSDVLRSTKDSLGRSLFDVVEPVVADFIPRGDGKFYQSDLVLVDKVENRVRGVIEFNGSLYHDPVSIRQRYERAKDNPRAMMEMRRFAMDQFNPRGKSACPPSLSRKILGDRSWRDATMEDYIAKVEEMNRGSYEIKKKFCSDHGIPFYSVTEVDIGTP